MAPNVLNLVVGDTRTLQALDGTSHAVTGLNWVSSDPTVVSLSGDDPPVLTGVTAGAASADVTVWDPSVLPGGTLPVGTVLWSNPGNGWVDLVGEPSKGQMRSRRWMGLRG